MLKFLGAPYPIVKTPRGLLPTQNGINQIKSDLLCLLLTNPGERCMLPDFGTPLRELIFDPNDSTLVEKAKEMIINSIKLWEPRISVSQIDVFTGAENIRLNSNDLRQDVEHILSIIIKFVDPENIQQVQELKLELPLAQGA